MSIAIINEASYEITINLSQVHFENIGIKISYLGLICAFCELLSMLFSKTHILISIICVSSISTFVSMIYPIVLDIQNKSISKNRATMLSIYSMFGNIFTSALNIIIGFGADVSLKSGFVIYFVAILFGVIGIFIYTKINTHPIINKNKVV